MAASATFKPEEVAGSTALVAAAEPAGLATWLWQVHQSPAVDPLVAALLQAAGVASVLPAFAAAALLAVAGAAASAGSAGPHSFSPPRPP